MIVKLFDFLCRLIVVLVVVFSITSNAQSVELDSEQQAVVENHSAAAPVIPFKIHSEIPRGFIIKLIAVLVVLLALASVLLYWVRQRYLGDSARQSGGSKLRVLEAKRISPKATVYVLSYEDRRVLLAQTGEMMVVLDKIIENDHHQQPMAEATRVDENV